MAIWKNIKDALWTSRASSHSVSDEDIAKLFRSGMDDPWTGIDADHLTVMGLPVVWACVRVLSETLASLPLFVYKRSEGGRERADNHPLYDLLHIKPNREQTAFQFKEQLQGHLGIFGNGYAQIIKEGTGYIKELIPLWPDKMDINRKTGELLYEYTDQNEQKHILTREEVFHIAGFGFDGIRGYAPLAINSQTFSLAIAAKRYAAEFYSNNGTPSFVITHPNKLTGPVMERLKESWKQNHSKWGKKHSALILEEGMKTEAIQIDPEKAQFIETQKFITTEICRIYRMQPHMVQDLERATFTNIEHQGIEFVTHTMRPWLVRWEQAIMLQLMTDKERKRYFAEFLIDALMRGDAVARWTSYRTAMETGALSANEVREMENKNKRENGDVYHVPANWKVDDGKNVEPVVAQPIAKPDMEVPA